MIFQNASNPLTLPTHEGSGQAVHPSVIDFKVEYDMDTWGGYRYWMAMTPYPFTNDAHEDPNLIASNDNNNWIVPDGIVNPLDDALGGMADGFHNDPDMIYNPDENEIWLYYRFSSNAKQEIKLIKITENMSVTEPIVVHNITPFSQAGNKTRSMCIWRENSTKWHMWGSGGTRPYKNYYYFSSDGLSWGEPIQVFNDNSIDPFHDIDFEVWHMSGKPNYSENRMEFMTYCYPFGGGNGSGAKIIFSTAHFSNLTKMNADPKPVLGTSSGGWDRTFLYRSSFVIEEIMGGYRYHLWYSAMGTGSVWGVGYTSTIVSDGTPIFPSEPRNKGTYWHEIKSSNAEGKPIDHIKVNLGYWHGVKEVFVKR